MPWTDTLYPWLIHSALVSLVVLAVGSVAAALCRQPARRVRIIELTLAGCLVAPCLGMIPWYPQFTVAWPQASPLDASDRGGMPLAEPAIGQSVPQADPLALAFLGPPSEPTAQAVEMPAPGFDVPSCIVGTYVLGVGLGLAWWLVGIAGLARIVATARPATPRCRELLTEIAGRRGDRVRLLVSRHVSQPFASAWWRPVIVLPEGLCADEQSLRWSLAHEWSHVQRHDFRAWLLAGLARVLFFYQPLVWWLRRQLRLGQDFLADAQAARHAPQPEDYAEFLTVRAAAGSLPPALAALGIGFRKSELYRRVVMLVQNRPLESRVPRLWNLAAMCAAFVLVSTVAALSIAPQAAAQGEPAAAKSDAKPARVDSALPSSTKSFTANFPSGITVELLGVSEHLSNAKSWWRPDGSPLAEPPCDPLNASVGSGRGYIGREFAIQWHNLPSEPVGTQVLFDPPYNAYAGAEPKRLGKKVASLEAMAVSLPNQQTVTVRVRLAAGPWQTVCETESGDMSTGTTKGGFAFSPIQEKDRRVTLTVTHDIIGPESRVIAVGLDGREHRAGSWSRNGARNFLQITATFYGVSQKDIKVFRVQTRPYDQVEFRNVSLQPGKKTDVRIGHLKILDPSISFGAVGPAQIELLEGPDVPVIRGKREDVQRIGSSLTRGGQGEKATVPDPSDAKKESLLKERRDTLRELVRLTEARYRSGRATLDFVIRASNQLLEAELDQAKTKAERIAIYDKLIANLRELEKILEARQKVGAPGGDMADLLDARTARLKAEIQLSQERSASSDVGVSPPKERSPKKPPAGGQPQSDSAEPGYAGKPLSYWRSRLHHENLETRIEAAQALREIVGPAARPAIPSLIELLRGKESKVLVDDVPRDLLRSHREIDRNGIIWEDGRPIGVWGINGGDLSESRHR